MEAADVCWEVRRGRLSIHCVSGTPWSGPTQLPTGLTHSLPTHPGGTDPGITRAPGALLPSHSASSEGPHAFRGHLGSVRAGGEGSRV